MPHINPVAQRDAILIKCRHQVQSSSLGIVTVFVVEQWQATNGEDFYTKRQFSFKPRPGDVMAQVDERLGK